MRTYAWGQLLETFDWYHPKKTCGMTPAPGCCQAPVKKKLARSCGSFFALVLKHALKRISHFIVLTRCRMFCWDKFPNPCGETGRPIGCYTECFPCCLNAFSELSCACAIWDWQPIFVMKLRPKFCASRFNGKVFEKVYQSWNRLHCLELMPPFFVERGSQTHFVRLCHSVVNIGCSMLFERIFRAKLRVWDGRPISV